MRMEEGDKVEEFFHRVDHVLNHLRDMGVVTDEKELVVILIRLLPESRDTQDARFLWKEMDSLTKDDLFRIMKLVNSQ